MSRTPGFKNKLALAARPDAFGDRGQFEKDRQDWAHDHPDNQGDKPEIYRPPSKSVKIVIPDPKKLPPKINWVTLLKALA